MIVLVIILIICVVAISMGGGKFRIKKPPTMKRPSPPHGEYPVDWDNK